MRLIALMSVAAAMLVAACDFQPGDPVQHALRDAAAARHAAALKTTEDESVPTAASPQIMDKGDELSRLIIVRRQAITTTRQLIANTSNPELKAQLHNDLEVEEARLQALEALREDR